MYPKLLPYMKISIISSIAALVSLCACTSNGTKTETDVNNTDTAEVVEATAATDSISTSADIVAVMKPDQDPQPTEGKAIVMDFSATWCGPCQKFKPIFHESASQYAAKAEFYTVDVDECVALAEKYNIKNIPCVVILSKDSEPVIKTGFMNETEFRTLLDSNIK